jgi:hypothetical protein
MWCDVACCSTRASWESTCNFTRLNENFGSRFCMRASTNSSALNAVMCHVTVCSSPARLFCSPVAISSTFSELHVSVHSSRPRPAYYFPTWSLPECRPAAA